MKKYLSLIKFSHTIFAMPFAMIGFFLGWVYRKKQMTVVAYAMTETDRLWVQLLLVVLCMVFARSAAMAFNRYLDRNYDAQNNRTAIREIPSGKIKANHALLFTMVMSVLFVACTLLINILCFYLSFVALFVILFYSYTKRFTALCHLVLGLGLSLAPLGAFLAVTGEFHWLPVLFAVVVMLWVSGFDIIYAMQDETFDRSLQLHSIPVFLGKKNALRLSVGLHTFCGLLLLLAGWQAAFGVWYWIGALFFCSLLVYQHTLVKPDDLSKVNIAFMTANGIASVVFAVFVICDIFSHVNQLQ